MPNANLSNYRNQTCMRDYFIGLGVELSSYRQSWGSKRGNIIVFRLWLDEVRIENKKIYVSVAKNENMDMNTESLRGLKFGSKERIGHLKCDLSQCKIFAVLCCRKERKQGQPSAISRYDDTHLLSLGHEINVIDRNAYLEVKNKVHTSNFPGRQCNFNSKQLVSLTQDECLSQIKEISNYAPSMN